MMDRNQALTDLDLALARAQESGVLAEVAHRIPYEYICAFVNTVAKMASETKR